MIASQKSPKRGRPRSPDILHTVPVLGSKVRYTLPEASHMLGISLSLLYQRIGAGLIAIAADGRRKYVTDAELRRYGEMSH